MHVVRHLIRTDSTSLINIIKEFCMYVAVVIIVNQLI